MEIEEAILNVLEKVDIQQQSIDVMLQLMSQKEEQEAPKPIVFTYPNDGTYASVGIGQITLDFGVGRINTIGALTPMKHSLDSEGQDTIKSLFVDADTSVKLQFDDSPDTYLVKPGKHRANHLNFRKLQITTVKSTNIMVFGSTDPDAIFEFEEERTKTIDIDTQTSVGTSWTGGSINVAHYKKGIIIANVTAFDTTTGNERMVLELEGSYDGTLWEHLRTFVDEANAGDNTTVTGDADRGKIEATGQYVIHADDLPVFIRTKATLTGTTPIVSLTMKGSFR